MSHRSKIVFVECVQDRLVVGSLSILSNLTTIFPLYSDSSPLFLFGLEQRLRIFVKVSGSPNLETKPVTLKLFPGTINFVDSVYPAKPFFNFTSTNGPSRCTCLALVCPELLIRLDSQNVYFGPLSSLWISDDLSDVDIVAVYRADQEGDNHLKQSTAEVPGLTLKSPQVI